MRLLRTGTHAGTPQLGRMPPPPQQAIVEFLHAPPAPPSHTGSSLAAAWYIFNGIRTAYTACSWPGKPPKKTWCASCPGQMMSSHDSPSPSPLSLTTIVHHSARQKAQARIRSQEHTLGEHICKPQGRQGVTQPGNTRHQAGKKTGRSQATQERPIKQHRQRSSHGSSNVEPSPGVPGSAQGDPQAEHSP